MASTSKPGDILNDNLWGIVYAINIYKLAKPTIYAFCIRKINASNKMQPNYLIIQFCVGN